MKISPRQFIRSRYPWAIAAGLVLAATFPNLGIAGFGWIAPGLFLAAALGTRGGQSFRIGYVAGLTHYLVSLNWLLRIPFRWHGIPFAPALGWLALGAFLASFTGVWVWLCGKFADRSPAPNWSRRAAWALSCAAAWVAMEMVVARIFSGFPWNLLGASQYRLLPLIQIASFTGVYGVSFLLVWTSVSLLNAVVAILRRPALRSIWIGEVILPMVAVFGLFVSGFHRLAHGTSPERTLKVTLVQPSIPQTLIWDSDRDMDRFQELVRLSEQALTNDTDLLIWPEAGVPGLPRYRPDLADPISELARTHKVWMIIGADDVELTPTATNFFNASMLISPEGKLAAVYHKRGLVIFGEYVPLVRWLPFLKWLVPGGEGFKSGDRPVPFELTGWGERPRELPLDPQDGSRGRSSHPSVKTSVLICFEDIFPNPTRAYVEPDTDFLVNITNDGWFGEGSAQRQQAACAVFRAVENGLPLVRCANTGLTCWADATGRLRKIFTDDAGSIYGAGFMTAEIPLLSPGRERAPTFYRRHGDWFGWGCTGLTLLALLSAGLRRRSGQ